MRTCIRTYFSTLIYPNPNPPPSSPQALLAGLAVRGAGGTNLNVFIDEAKLAEGDASVVYTRGKYKYIYDLCIDVCFIMTPEQELDDRLNLTARIDGKSTRGKVRESCLLSDMFICCSVLCACACACVSCMRVLIPLRTPTHTYAHLPS